MSGTRFRHQPALPELPKGAERAIIEQFRAVEQALDVAQGVQRNATPVMNTASYFAKPGELVLLEGRAGGTLITIPPGSSQNIEQSIRVALVGGVLSPGVTIAIIGRKGTINGSATLVMTTRGIAELTSVGDRGWVAMFTATGGGGGGEDLAATLAIGNVTGGTPIDFSAGDELRFAGNPGAAGEVATSQGPGLEPVWAPAGGATPAWSAVLGAGNTSGANSPSINAGQRLDFATGGLAGGDVRGATALALTATTGTLALAAAAGLLTGTATLGLAFGTSGGNIGFTATAGAATMSGVSANLTSSAGLVTIAAGGANILRFRTNGVTRLDIQGAGAWDIGGSVGAAGNVLTSNGPGTPPTWTAPAAATVAMTDATITLPYAGAHSGTATVVDAAIGAGSRVGIFWGSVLDTDANSPELDDVTFTCTPAAGSMSVRVSSDKAPVGGPYKIRYLIG